MSPDSISRRRLLRSTVASSTFALAALLCRSKSLAQSQTAAAEEEPASGYRVRILNFLPHVARGGRVSVIFAKEGVLTDFEIWFEPADEVGLVTLPTATADKPGMAFSQRPSLSLKVDRLSDRQVLLETRFRVPKVLRNDPSSHLFEAVTTNVHRVVPLSIGEKMTIPMPQGENAKAFELLIQGRAT